MQDAEIITVEIERSEFERLCQTNNFKYTIKQINIPDYPYHNHDRWVAQKKKADKEYRQLRKIEYDIRNPII